MPQTWIGVDLSKVRLDIFDPRSVHHCLAHTEADIRAWLDGLDPQVIVVFDAASLTLLAKMPESTGPTSAPSPRLAASQRGRAKAAAGRASA